MQREVIDTFPEHRWASLETHQHGLRVVYGIGRLCASYVLFADPVEALFAKANWEQNGVEPKRVGTLQGMPRVTDEQLEAWRFEAAAQRLEVRP